MNDITIIMLTPNKVPKQWAEYHKGVLLEAIGDTPLITISKEPLDWGQNIIQTEYGLLNLYKQLLRGAKLASTPYVAVAEDDTLYPKEHFEFRPPLNKIAYDLNRWVTFTWGEPFYFHKPHFCTGGMIAPRELLIFSLEEKFNKYPDKMPTGLLKEVGRNDWEKRNRITPIPTVSYYAKYPYLCFNHDFSVELNQANHIKRVWPVRAFDIPKWGRAEEIVKRFK